MWQLAPGQLTNVAAVMPSGFLPETNALIARFSTPPTNARAILINNLIGSLMTATVWSTLDFLYVMAAADSQAAKLNWITNAFNATEVLVPTFVADRGFTGDGLASYLDSGFNPATAPTPKFALNDATMMHWSLTNLPNPVAASNDMGSNNSRIGRSGSVLGTMTYRPNNGTTTTVAAAYPGFSGWVRTGSAAFRAYTAGADIGGGVTASASITSANILVCATTAVLLGVNQEAIALVGSQWTAPQQAAAFTAFQTYLQAVGAV